MNIGERFLLEMFCKVQNVIKENRAPCIYTILDKYDVKLSNAET